MSIMVTCSYCTYTKISAFIYHVDSKSGKMPGSKVSNLGLKTKVKTKVNSSSSLRPSFIAQIKVQSQTWVSAKDKLTQCLELVFP